MRKWTLVLICLFNANLFAQVELEFLGQATYPEDVVLNDIWGYYDEATDKEYALVGMTTGLSIVDVTDPTNPEKLHFIDGPQSTWRDIKTYGHYAYTVTEAEAGLLVTDLSLLPDSITYNYTTLNTEMNTAHNIWIDEFGFAYVVGYNNVGDSLASAQKGALILDLNEDAWEPPIVGAYNDKYFHDVYVRDNIMYSSNINEGTFSVYDVSDKANIVLLASKTTPNEFTHNAWLSDNSEYLFTTDERADGSVASYNIADLSDISEAHLYKSSLGTAKIPHNAHVLDDWIIVSYYTDGIRILDANNPEILVETAYYDTSPLDNSGFGGCWGAYPFLPSGNILASDRQEGLFVLGPDYQRAAYVQGTVSEENSTQVLNWVDVDILATNSKVHTNNFGLYKTGTTFENESALFSITYERYGYYPLQLDEVTLTKEEVLELDVALTPKPFTTPQLIFQDAQTGLPIEGVYSNLYHTTGLNVPPFGFYEDFATSSENGEAQYEELHLDQGYVVIGSKWGYETTETEIVFLNDDPIVIEMEPAYYDAFFYSDSTSAASVWSTEIYDSEAAGENGDWEYVLLEPGSGHFWPTQDSQEDFGDGCYTTGANFGSTNGIINDSTTLISPSMDLSNFDNPILTFDAYLFATNAEWVPERGSLLIEISDGENTTLLKSFPDTTDQSLGQWEYNGITLNDFVTPTEDMQIHFTLYSNSVEYLYLDASIDRFEIIEGPPSLIPNNPSEELVIYPNPSSGSFNIDLKNGLGNYTLNVYDLQSRKIESHQQMGGSTFAFGAELIAGMYIVQLLEDGELRATSKLVKRK